MLLNLLLQCQDKQNLQVTVDETNYNFVNNADVSISPVDNRLQIF